jgi:hypothetical protein
MFKQCDLQCTKYFASDNSSVIRVSTPETSPGMVEQPSNPCPLTVVRPIHQFRRFTNKLLEMVLDLCVLVQQIHRNLLSLGTFSEHCLCKYTEDKLRYMLFTMICLLMFQPKEENKFAQLTLDRYIGVGRYLLQSKPLSETINVFN